jgi:hypothetical protein
MIFVDHFCLGCIVVVMTNELMTIELRKERLESLLSTKRHKVAVRTVITPRSCFMASARCCAKGEWKLAATYFTTSMNHFWTTIVNPTEGANRKH